MKFLDNTSLLCFEYDEFVPAIMTEANYKQSKSRGTIKVHGRGGNGNQVLIEFESLPQKFRELAKATYGDPYSYVAKQPLLRLVQTDLAARAYYAAYLLPDGRYLPSAYQARYSRQADWLNMIRTVLADKRTLKTELKITIEQFWSNVIALHQNDRLMPELPTSEKRLRMKLRGYETDGYTFLVEAHRFVQDNARKVDNRIENLLIALYCRHTKPYYTDVCRDYNAFMAGTLQVVDLETGESFQPETFLVKGAPYEVKVETVKHYLSKPLNRAVVDKVRMSALQFSSTHRPFMQRKAPFYAFSKITMDDTSSPFKMIDGTRPATYKIFDVASGALVAMAMHRNKHADVALIRTVLMDMMTTIVRKGWGMPHEVEVENALTSTMTGSNAGAPDVLTVGTVFPFVHFCAPRNPQEKRAEGFIRLLKQQYHKKREGFQHRPFARLEANRMNDDSQSHKARFSFEQIEQMEREDMESWNNELHPDQQLYGGLSRWQVLEQNQNPALVQPNLPGIMPYIGQRTDTSIRRGFVQVQYNSYRLAAISDLADLHSDKLTAYWMPNEAGDIPKVYLYQDGEFVCEAPIVDRFQEAKAEQTTTDLRIMGRQKNYVSGFDSLVESRLPAQVGVMKPIQESPLKPVAVAAWRREDAESEPDQDGVDALFVPMLPKNLRKNGAESGSNKGGYLQNPPPNDPAIFDPEAIRARALRGI